MRSYIYTSSSHRFSLPAKISAFLFLWVSLYFPYFVSRFSIVWISFPKFLNVALCMSLPPSNLSVDHSLLVLIFLSLHSFLSVFGFFSPAWIFLSFFLSFKGYWISCNKHESETNTNGNKYPTELEVIESVGQLGRVNL